MGLFAWEVVVVVRPRGRTKKKARAARCYGFSALWHRFTSEKAKVVAGIREDSYAEDSESGATTARRMRAKRGGSAGWKTGRRGNRCRDISAPVRGGLPGSVGNTCGILTQGRSASTVRAALHWAQRMSRRRNRGGCASALVRSRTRRAYATAPRTLRTARRHSAIRRSAVAESICGR